MNKDIYFDCSGKTSFCNLWINKPYHNSSSKKLYIITSQCFHYRHYDGKIIKLCDYHYNNREKFSWNKNLILTEILIDPNLVCKRKIK